MPTSQADMEKLLKGRWYSGSKELLLNCELEAYTAGEMQQLCSLIPKACPDVKVLAMAHNELDDAQAAAVPEALERLPHLENLWLWGDNKFGGEAAAKIFIAAVRHCLHLDRLNMPKHCDPNTIDWAQLGVTMSPDVLAAARKDSDGDWDWCPMVKKQREMQAAGLVAPLPTVAAGVDQAKQAEAEPKTKPEAEAEAKKKPDEGGGRGGGGGEGAGGAGAEGKAAEEAKKKKKEGMEEEEEGKEEEEEAAEAEGKQQADVLGPPPSLVCCGALCGAP